MPMRADRLREILSAYGTEASPRDLAEVLWLAAHVGPLTSPPPVLLNTAPPPTADPEPVTPSPAAAPTPAISPSEATVPLHLPGPDDSPSAGAAELLAPAAPALGDRLALQRALRP